MVPVHVHIMAAKVERDKELEDERVVRVRRREITKQTTCRRPIVGPNDPDHKIPPQSEPPTRDWGKEVEHTDQ